MAQPVIRRPDKQKDIMNSKFDELKRKIVPSLSRHVSLKVLGTALIGCVMAGSIPAAAQAQSILLGPLIELSQPNPLAGCNSGFVPPGTMTLNDAAEPALAVSPVNPNNMVAAWIGGDFQNVITATSFDGGFTWQQVPLPATSCASSQPYGGAGDPTLSFAPNGDLYASVIVGFSFSAKLVAVCKSTDGGLHWSAPILMAPDIEPTNDGEMVVADPTNSRLVYNSWTQSNVKNHSWIEFTRSTDGGQTWETARTLYEPQPQSFADDPQVFVMPDAALVMLYQFYTAQANKSVQYSIGLLRSYDHGKTWSTPTTAFATTPVLRPDGSGASATADPETGQPVADHFSPLYAVDPRNGNLYVVWEEGRFSGFQYNDIAFSMSTDRGTTWSAPIRINQTPLNIPTGNRQCFFATVAVAANGTIGVSYYDFRLNTPAAGLPTDYWLVQCRPTANKPATDPANWGREVRLTDSSFDMEACAMLGDGFFPGDYFALAAAGTGGFVAAFTAVDQNRHTSIFVRRVGQ
jgi:hypothetical protein